MKKNILVVAMLCMACLLHAQEKQWSANTYMYKGDSAYRAKSYLAAARFYAAVVSRADFKVKQHTAAYNAACCYALIQVKDSAQWWLQKAIALGYNNKENMQSDGDLAMLQADSITWKKILATLKPVRKSLNSDPAKARFITADISRFWQAYDAYLKDTAHAFDIFKTYYFDKATVGMNDYMGLKVGSIRQFIQHIQQHPRFYAAVRSNTLKANAYKPQFAASFKKMKALYPEALFPDVYFVVGAFTSGGTVSNAGLLIGINQICKDSTTPLAEFDTFDQLLLNKVHMLPHTIAHELIHFQQHHNARDTTTLSYAINEGMADFIGELISGQSSNPQLLVWVKGKEKKTWERFTKDMYFDRYNKWLANYDNIGPDNFPDLGYWVGYEICKSYYEHAANKKQAIYDMLHIQDYRAFLAASKWVEKLYSQYP